MEKPQRLARRQEISSAEFYGARLVPASGSRDHKGDAYTDTVLFEFKHTERQSFGMRIADWKRHAWQATVVDKQPVWEIEYTDPTGRHRGYIVCVDRNDYLAQRDELAELRWRISQLEK